jgi:hypothetical protein
MAFVGNPIATGEARKHLTTPRRRGLRIAKSCFARHRGQKFQLSERTMTKTQRALGTISDDVISNILEAGCARTDLDGSCLQRQERNTERQSGTPTQIIAGDRRGAGVAAECIWRHLFRRASKSWSRS